MLTEKIMSSSSTKFKNLNKQIENLYDAIINMAKTFNINDDYKTIYRDFKNSIDPEYLEFFTDILDASSKKIIDEINNKNNINIDIIFKPILNSSATNRKLFFVAKELAVKIINIYSINANASERVIDNIEKYLPATYTKDKDISIVIWYFLVCISSYNQNSIVS